MDTFGFTRKKFKTLSEENQNKKIIAWLSGVYQKLISNRFKPSSLGLIAEQYNQVLAWKKMALFVTPDCENTRAWIEAISDRIHFHRCEAGLFFQEHNLLEGIQVNEGDDQAEIKRIDCHVALDGLRSLFNVGSVIRTCEAAGFSSVILGNTPGGEHPRVQKTAMGAHQWLTQEKTLDLAQALIQKKEQNYKIVGIETTKNAKAFDEFPWEEKTIVVLGNEEYGISSHVLKTCDECVHIPMFGKKNSINVSNAAAIICFQIAGSIIRRSETG